MDDLRQVFSTAIEFEEAGYNFYIDAANKMECPIACSILQALADDEKYHERLLREFYEAMIESKSWPIIDDGSNTPEEARRKIMAAINDASDVIKADPTFTGIYKTARKMEEDSRNFYRNEYGNAKDIHVRKFLEFLARFEDIHVQALDALLQSMNTLDNEPDNNDN